MNKTIELEFIKYVGQVVNGLKHGQGKEYWYGKLKFEG
jgi:hypothetical protein